jgi:hypothetical protein
VNRKGYARRDERGLRAALDRVARRGRRDGAEGAGDVTAPGRYVYTLVSGNWGIGAIAFGLGAAVLGLDRLRVARARSERAIGWVLVACGAFVVVDALI